MAARPRFGRNGLVRPLRGGAGLRRPDRPPALALLVFWFVSYAVWALVFGVQRYVVLLEVLALPVIAIGVSLALPRLPTSPASLLMLILLAAILGGTTKIVDFGRRPMGWAPLVPTETIEPLSRYDAVVIAAPPLAYLRAVTRNAPGASGQTWLGVPFDDADRVVAEEALRGKSIGILFYSADRASVEGSASTLGLRVTDECLSFESPVPGGIVTSSLEVCTASPSP